MRISLLIATCNRCDKLRLLLDALKTKGSAGPMELEVLVIDNNSSDATGQAVAEYTSSEDPVFRYLLERQPGKSRALNAGVREARGEILAFTDDDCIPAPGWVETILKEFDSDPDLSVIGGRVEPYDKTDLPQAILLSIDRTLVKSARQVCQTPTIIGANMAFRKTALKAAGEFDPLLGPGSRCLAAEDIDLLYRALKMKFKIAYSPEVLIIHNHGRKTQFEEHKTSFGYGVGRGGLYVKHIMRFDIQIAKIAFTELYDLAKTLLKGALTQTEFPYHRLTLRAIFLGAFYYCKDRMPCRQYFGMTANSHEAGDATSPSAKTPSHPRHGSRRKMGGLLVRREHWTLSLRAKALVLAMLVGTTFATMWFVHPFLAVTHREDANFLVVEGWVHPFAINAAVKEFNAGRYDRIFVTGGPVEGSGGYSNDYNTAASVGADLLKKAGIPDGSLQMVPSRVWNQDRTYFSAIALRDWFREHKVQVRSINLLTEDAHARRTWLLFQEALGKGVQVGIISASNPDYNASHWWRYSEGVREVIGEAIAYTYAKFFFWPGSK